MSPGGKRVLRYPPPPPKPSTLDTLITLLLMAIWVYLIFRYAVH